MADLQRTDDWFSDRLGKVTASAVAKVMAKLKSGAPSADRSNYHAQLVTERLTGKPTESFTNAAMQRGIDLEPQARAMYSFATGHDVEEVGFVPHPTIAAAGASPDGLCGDVGLVEIKCCGAARHIEMLTGSEPEDRYLKQIQFQMACTGRDWCDLAYFSPDFPEEMQLVVRRFDRDPALIEAMEAEIVAFLGEVDATVSDLHARYLQREAA
jgi:putative phage-type endonuclease